MLLLCLCPCLPGSFLNLIQVTLQTWRPQKQIPHTKVIDGAATAQAGNSFLANMLRWVCLPTSLGTVSPGDSTAPASPRPLPVLFLPRNNTASLPSTSWAFRDIPPDAVSSLIISPSHRGSSNACPSLSCPSSITPPCAFLPCHPTDSRHDGEQGIHSSAPPQRACGTNHQRSCVPKVGSHHTRGRSVPCSWALLSPHTIPGSCSLLLQERSDTGKAVLRQAEGSLWLQRTEQSTAKWLGKFCDFFMRAPLPSPRGLPAGALSLLHTLSPCFPAGYGRLGI